MPKTARQARSVRPTETARRGRARAAFPSTPRPSTSGPRVSSRERAHPGRTIASKERCASTSTRRPKKASASPCAVAVQTRACAKTRRRASLQTVALCRCAWSPATPSFRTALRDNSAGRPTTASPVRPTSPGRKGLRATPAKRPTDAIPVSPVLRARSFPTAIRTVAVARSAISRTPRAPALRVRRASHGLTIRRRSSPTSAFVPDRYDACSSCAHSTMSEASTAETRSHGLPSCGSQPSGQMSGSKPCADARNSRPPTLNEIGAPVVSSMVPPPNAVAQLRR